MNIGEWIEALSVLPREMVAEHLACVACAHCRATGVAVMWEGEEDALVVGWYRRADEVDEWACSSECADALGRAWVKQGKKRPRWRLAA